MDHVIRLEADIKKGFVKNSFTVAIFFYYMQPFDKVCRQGLLYKINSGNT